MQSLRVRIAGDNLVSVPASLTCLTTYVLLEQEDWFEKEIAWVRRAIMPGMRAVDIGANYGVYSVALARAVGTAGRVWAYEPSTVTHRALLQTLSQNKLGQVDAQACALSDFEGTGQLSIEQSSELNSLVATQADRTEPVAVTTLDAESERLGIRDIDFVKLDAEGAELGIIQGAPRFFESEDPLVMFEVTHGTTANAGLPDAFRERGFGLFRLVGPSRLLVPSPAGERLDRFELNLFACKPGCAAALAQRGLLVHGPTHAAAPTQVSDGIAAFEAQAFASSWPRGARVPGAALGRALSAYSQWLAGATPLERVAGLTRALAELEPELQRTPSAATLSMLARVAFESARRELAVAALGRLLAMASRGQLQITEPCWPASARFDTLTVAGDPAGFIVASAIEAIVSWFVFSSYFADANNPSFGFLDRLQQTPYASAPMERRRQLQLIRTGRASAVTAHPLLAHAAPNHLNADFWTQAAAEDTSIPGSLVREIR